MSVALASARGRIPRVRAGLTTSAWMLPPSFCSGGHAMRLEALGDVSFRASGLLRGPTRRLVPPDATATKRQQYPSPCMPIPRYDDLMLPLLRVTSDGAVHRFRDLVGVLAAEYGLTQDQVDELLPSGKQPTFRNRLNWGVDPSQEGPPAPGPGEGSGPDHRRG